jgi:hypothetical protein
VNQSPCWETDSYSSNQVIFRLLWNTKLRYHDCKSKSLCHVNQVHNFPSYFVKIHFNIILHLRLGFLSGFAYVIKHVLFVTTVSTLTVRSRALLETLILTLLVMKFHAFYGSRRFITVFTRVCTLRGHFLKQSSFRYKHAENYVFLNFSNECFWNTGTSSFSLK